MNDEEALVAYLDFLMNENPDETEAYNLLVDLTDQCDCGNVNDLLS